MVITRLSGGLGNQMFQYAAGKRLACHLGVPLMIDTSLFSAQHCATAREYALDAFALEDPIATADDLRPFLPRHGLSRWLPRFARHRTYYRERHFHFDPAVLELRGEVCLDGYWQSERYFSDIAGTIREAFRFKQPLSGKNLHLYQQIRDVEAVSLHVRRGDYVSDEKTHRWHGVCGVDYYDRAINHIVEHVSGPNFFVFSDDLHWASNHLKFRHPVTFVDHNPPEMGHEDMRLMSFCRHHIIANSSFSWWGAWLNPNPGKIVIAPRKWFSGFEADTRDLYPEGWLRF